MRKRVLYLVLCCGLLAASTFSIAPAGRIISAAYFQGAPRPVTSAAPQTPQGPGPDVRLPLEAKSVRFAVIGDSGTGDSAEFQVGQELEQYRQRVGFDFVIMLGDNIYDNHSPDDFTKKFELPFKPLLDAGVKFYASLGNHDDPNVERLYKPFNMGGERYYVFKKGDVAFFVLDSNYMDPTQLAWLEKNLQSSQAKWKIAYFHHPLYSDGKAHGPDLDLRARIAPLFQKYGVNVVFSGHEHMYERIKPEDGIAYFISGNSGKLMDHNLRPSPLMQAGLDTDRGFMLIEISGDKMYFQAISRTGKTVDSGSIDRAATQPAAAAAGAAH
jgi:3',5'-cyclic AMP phosphodiesterase CpdA